MNQISLTEYYQQLAQSYNQQYQLSRTCDELYNQVLTLQGQRNQECQQYQKAKQVIKLQMQQLQKLNAQQLIHYEQGQQQLQKQERTQQPFINLDSESSHNKVIEQPSIGNSTQGVGEMMKNISKQINKNGNQFSCPKCGKQLKTEIILIQHLVRIHNVPRMEARNYQSHLPIII